MTTKTGTANNDILIGTFADDEIFGEAGNDTIFGGDGDDIIHDGSGFDTLFGGNGNDVFQLTDNNRFGPTDLVNPTGLPSIYGGLGTDTVDASEAIANIHFAASVFAFASIEVFIGSSFDDIVDATGTNFNLILLGGPGNDTFVGGLGNDHLVGEVGNDFLEGGFGADVLTGGTRRITEDALAEHNTAPEGDVEDGQGPENDDSVQPSGISADGDDAVQETAPSDPQFDPRPQNPFAAQTEDSSDDQTNDLQNTSSDNSGTPDPLTGVDTSDTFSFPDLTHSLLSSHDTITDLEIGIDKVVGPHLVTASNLPQLGGVSSLNELDIAAVVTRETLVPLGAATFTFGDRTFLALNNEVAGFNANADALIEITGFTGTLANLEVSSQHVL